MRIVSGTVLNGRYLVLKELGEGGFGTVYHARDQELNRDVALKVLKADAQVDRFVRESRLLARLSHPNIVTVFSVELLDDQIPMIVLDYLEGESLKSFMNKHENGLPYESCRGIFEQICAGLSYAHKNNIVHRDLSSANVFLVNEKKSLHVKLLDFGLSKLAGGTEDACQKRLW